MRQALLAAIVLAFLAASLRAEGKLSASPDAPKPLSGHTRPVTSVAFSPSGRLLVSASDDDSIRIRDGLTQKLLRTISADSGGVAAIAFSPDEKSLVSGGWDGTVKIWSLPKGTLKKTLRGHEENITCVAISHNGKQIASGSGDDSLRVRDAASGDELFVVELDDEYDFTAVVFAPDGKQIVTGDGEGHVRIWDAETGDEVKTISAHEGSVTSLAMGRRQSVSGGRDGILESWTLSGQRKRTFRGHADEVTSVAIGCGGLRIVSASDDGSLRVWDIGNGRVIGTRQSPGQASLNAVAMSPDGTQLVAGCGKAVLVWPMQKCPATPATQD